uniref:HAT C-terminal dimerisation domain-containing protein n=1 Tax=Quercus lobata TaxID=97700 RepID=A0A7N2R311_QUELO
MMERVKDAIIQCHDNTLFPYDRIWEIFNERRNDIIHPIHAVAAFLNPAYMCSEKFKENVELTNGINFALEHLVDEEEKEAFINQVQLYRMKVSNLFTAQAIIMLKTSHPHIWWEFCGNHLPVLQKYAIRILSQPCGSSVCKRYQLGPKYGDDNAFMVNIIIMERHKVLETQMLEAINLDKLDELSYNVKYQHIVQEEWDERRFESPLFNLTESHVDDMINSATCSWLDTWHS